VATGPTSDAGSNDDAIESIRNDAFEHAYAVRWLTTLVAQKTTLRGHDDDNDHDVNLNVEVEVSASTSKPDKAATEPDPDPEEDTLMQSAAALLAVCAGTASAGTRTRTYVLCGVRVQLTDVALRNDDFGSVGAQTWGSACVLAEMIAEAPDRFGLLCRTGDDDDSVFCRGGGGPRVVAGIARVLELGAGTGLVSLTIGKILEKSHERDSRRAGTVVVASDFYPPALENLGLNIQRNFPPKDDDGDDSAPSARNFSIAGHFLDWEEAADLTRALQAPFDEPFDEVFGADIVYELEHAMWIKACLKRVLRLTGRFHLVIPLRENFARESATVERVFPHVEVTHREMEVGPTLCITQKENITCEAGPDGKGEVEYVHYTIQWALGGDR
jgi:predicted nicotinamide N-methyase